MLNARLGTGRAWLSTRLEQTKLEGSSVEMAHTLPGPQRVLCGIYITLAGRRSEHGLSCLALWDVASTKEEIPHQPM